MNPARTFYKFQSTLPLRGATRRTFERNAQHGISIHTPLAGSDSAEMSVVAMTVFQSTLPLRGATSRCRTDTSALLFQSTLPLRGATQHPREFVAKVRISIHTPLAGSDNVPSSHGQSARYFNPHSPCGERLRAERGSQDLLISIHTPLAGSDFLVCERTAAHLHFNPHSPCGERPQK